ncbi:hypothetical protein BH11MYX4_BH11MYX4_38720 [soil metagenome]
MGVIPRAATFLLTLSGLALACSLGAGVKDRCNVDGDCNPGRTCQAGICGDPQPLVDPADGAACPVPCLTGGDGGPAGDTGSDATTPRASFLSCAGGGAGKRDCGPNHDEDCCASLPVVGGTFYRSYDGVTFTDKTAPATVSSFALDKFEITVGRFRTFTKAVVAGFRPQPGDGKHAHLPKGGLNGGVEVGWDQNWTPSLVTTTAAWDSALACAAGATWTSLPGTSETLPITCASWVDLYAFCIWDGGFLPTEAEWNYAAAGGGEQRVFPWSTPPPSSSVDCTTANYSACGPAVAYAGKTTAGRGRWGQADLAGNVWERTLDVFVAAYASPSVDLAALSGTDRVLRGGSYVSSAAAATLTSSFRNHAPDVSRDVIVGGRCARAPL